MHEIINLDDITREIRLSRDDLLDHCSSVSDVLFFLQPAEKWSVAQNVKHLIISTNKTKLAYSLPKFIIRRIVGKPNRQSRTYRELVDKYKNKLQQGGKASGPFIPKIVLAEYGRERILNEFAFSIKRLSNCIEKKWTDPQLDKYIAPHPLLGKITLRELGYFTIHHIQHHLQIIRNRV
jgi:hypothetical protein